MFKSKNILLEALVLIPVASMMVASNAGYSFTLGYILFIGLLYAGESKGFEWVKFMKNILAVVWFFIFLIALLDEGNPPLMLNVYCFLYFVIFAAYLTTSALNRVFPNL